MSGFFKRPDFPGRLANSLAGSCHEDSSDDLLACKPWRNLIVSRQMKRVLRLATDVWILQKTGFPGSSGERSGGILPRRFIRRPAGLQTLERPDRQSSDEKSTS